MTGMLAEPVMYLNPCFEELDELGAELVRCTSIRLLPVPSSSGATSSPACCVVAGLNGSGSSTSILDVPEHLLAGILALAADNPDRSSRAERALARKTMFSICGTCHVFRKLGSELFFSCAWKEGRLIHPRGLFTLRPTPSTKNLMRCFIVRQPLKMSLMGPLSRFTLFAGLHMNDPRRQFLLRADQVNKMKFVISVARTTDTGSVAVLQGSLGRTSYSLRPISDAPWVREQMLACGAGLAGGFGKLMHAASMNQRCKQRAVAPAGWQVEAARYETEVVDEAGVAGSHKELDLELPLMEARYHMRVANLLLPRRVVVELPQPAPSSQQGGVAPNRSLLASPLPMSPSMEATPTPRQPVNVSALPQGVESHQAHVLLGGLPPPGSTPMGGGHGDGGDDDPLDLSALAVPRTMGIRESVDAVLAAMTSSECPSRFGRFLNGRGTGHMSSSPHVYSEPTHRALVSEESSVTLEASHSMNTPLPSRFRSFPAPSITIPSSWGGSGRERGASNASSPGHQSNNASPSPWTPPSPHSSPAQLARTPGGSWLGPRSCREMAAVASSLPPVIQLQNRLPHWNPELRCWCLNFDGRVRMPSIKNFQLMVTGDVHERVVLQFGKVKQSRDTAVFALDFNPSVMTPFQAFALALTSFDMKILL